jgi:hypothetical protein
VIYAIVESDDRSLLRRRFDWSELLSCVITRALLNPGLKAGTVPCRELLGWAALVLWQQLRRGCRDLVI